MSVKTSDQLRYLAYAALAFFVMVAAAGPYVLMRGKKPSKEDLKRGPMYMTVGLLGTLATGLYLRTAERINIERVENVVVKTGKVKVKFPSNKVIVEEGPANLKKVTSEAQVWAARPKKEKNKDTRTFTAGHGRYEIKVWKAATEDDVAKAVKDTVKGAIKQRQEEDVAAGGTGRLAPGEIIYPDSREEGTILRSDFARSESWGPAGWKFWNGAEGEWGKASWNLVCKAMRAGIDVRPYGRHPSTGLYTVESKKGDRGC